MTIKPDDERLVYIPFEEASNPPNGLLEHHKDCWWCVHPEKGIIFFRPHKKEQWLAPQCNRDERCARAVQQKLYPWAELRKIPSVFRRINPRDYC